MTPAAMSEAIASLTPSQRICVEKMGFKAFLNFKIEKIPMKLSHFVLNNYHEDTNSIVIGDKRLKITKEKIHKAFGLPMGGKSIFDFDPVDEEHRVIDRWLKQLKERKANATNYKDHIKASSEADEFFKLSFLSLFVNTLAESLPMGTSNLITTRRLVGVEDISSINWGGYLSYCLRNTKGNWQPDNVKCYYNGPMVLLLLIYCYGFECKCPKIQAKGPVFSMWEKKRLIDRQSFEIEAGGFGVGKLVKKNQVLEGDDEGSLLQIMEKDNQRRTIEECEEMFENVFKYVSIEKQNLKEIVCSCISTFPNENRTKELLKKFNDLFSGHRNWL